MVAARAHLDQETVDRIRKAVTETRELQHHEMYLDGGRSYREFWIKGDALFDDLTTLSQSTP